MTSVRLEQRPAFEITGKKTWISGQDNDLFGNFWQQCRSEGLFEKFQTIQQGMPGPQTNGMVLGVSLVQQDPSVRSFFYIISIECPEACNDADLEKHTVPAAQWAVFECRGKMPEALVEAEMFAFMQWLPNSGYIHAAAPEMEVYPPTTGETEDEIICEFWLPVIEKT